MKEAIQKAIEGGYDLKKGMGLPEGVSTFPEELIIASFLPHKHLLDPLFWQSLGKALGWKHKFYCDEGSGNSWYCEECRRAKTSLTRKEVCPKGYLIKWHHLIDHLAEGKDPEEFFNQLLK